MENIKVSRELNIFGKSVPVKNYGCCRNGGPYEEKPEPLQIRLSICPTGYCPAVCPFCSARDVTGSRTFLDIEKLRRVLEEFRTKDALSGISITGGEPFTDIVLLNEIVEMIFEIFGLEFEISINTNGSGLRDIDRIAKYPFIDAIHISRHHYDDDKNRQYFCGGSALIEDSLPIPTEAELTELTQGLYDKKLFVFNCLLFKDGIGTKEEIKKYMEFSDRVGVPKVGFITPMPVNSYVAERAVSYRELFDRSDPDFLFRKCFRDFEFCHCTDAMYATKSGRIMHFYGRETGLARPEYSRGLVYTADNRLQTGYSSSSEVIIEL